MVFAITLILVILHIAQQIHFSRKFSKRMKREHDFILKQRLEEMEARKEVFAQNTEFYEELYIKSNPQDNTDFEMDRQVRAGIYEPVLLEVVFEEELRARRWPNA